MEENIFQLTFRKKIISQCLKALQARKICCLSGVRLSFCRSVCWSSWETYSPLALSWRREKWKAFCFSVRLSVQRNDKCLYLVNISFSSLFSAGWTVEVEVAQSELFVFPSFPHKHVNTSPHCTVGRSRLYQIPDLSLSTRPRFRCSGSGGWWWRSALDLTTYTF